MNYQYLLWSYECSTENFNKFLSSKKPNKTPTVYRINVLIKFISFHCKFVICSQRYFLVSTKGCVVLCWWHGEILDVIERKRRGKLVRYYIKINQRQGLYESLTRGVPIVTGVVYIIYEKSGLDMIWEKS